MKQKILFALAGLLAFQIAGNAQTTRLSVTAPNLKADSVVLDTRQTRLALPYQAEKAMDFECPGYTGYAWLHIGGKKNLVYLEADKQLAVHYQKNTNHQISPYTYAGDLAKENEWLAAHERINAFTKKSTTAAEVIARLETAESKALQELEQQPLSRSFKQLESKRESCIILKSFRYFKGDWDGKLTPFLQKHFTEEPDLLILKDYTSFAYDAVLGLAYNPDNQSLYDATLRQLEYVDKSLKENAVREVVADEIINFYMTMRGPDRLDQLLPLALRLITDEARKQEVVRKSDKWFSMAKGKEAGDFVFHDVNDKEVRLSDFRGKYVFVDCWATWCGPCMRQIPHVKKLEEEFAGKNIVFLCVSCDNQKMWKAHLEKNKMGGVQVIMNDKCGFNERFAVNAIPRFMLIDPDGRMVDPMMYRPSEPECREILQSVCK